MFLRGENNYNSWLWGKRGLLAQSFSFLIVRNLLNILRSGHKLPKEVPKLLVVPKA